MQSVIVEIYVPAISSSFDFRLPSTGRVGDIINEVVLMLESTQQNLLFDREQPILCDREREVVLRRQDTVAEAGIQDGTQLILV